VLERNDYLGGHAHTVTVEEPGQTVAVDTGFIVFNEPNYPLFTELLRELGVASQPSQMSFGVSCQTCGIEYSSRGLRGLFARPSQALNPSLYRMGLDIARFNRWATRATEHDSLGNRTMSDLRSEGRFSKELFDHYLRPMTGAIWSATGQDVDQMPLSFLLGFYRNHDLLQTSGHPQWRTVTGGSQRYVEALSRPFLHRVRLRTPALSVRRGTDGVDVRTAEGWEHFDSVVLATHTDQALRLLEDPTPQEASALSGIGYRENVAALHTDDSVLAVAPAAQASWNCHLDDCSYTGAPLRMTYDLSRLQGLDSRQTYCVTLNDDGRIAPDRVVTRMRYAHPVYSAGGLEARQQLRMLNGERRTFYCGAYMDNGFHEDGVRSGLEVAQLLSAKRAAA
jgi:hypothetical protein